MSRVKELIDELCPDGVVQLTLEDLIKLQRGSNPSEVSESGLYQIVTAGRQVLAYTTITNSSAQMISISSHGAYAGFVSFWNGPVWLANNVFGFHVQDRATMLPKFLFYFLKSREKDTSATAKGGGVPYINVGDLLRFLIPVPPLAVQEEIVRILDTFTELEVELEAELEARKQQITHYRSSLLDFSGDGSHPMQSLIDELSPEGLEELSLKDLFHVKGGFTPSKADPSLWERGSIPWFRMEDIRQNGRILESAIQQISPEALKSSGAFEANSLIIATSATIGEHALVTVPFMCNQRFTCLTLKPEFRELYDVKFLFYFCFKLSTWCEQNTVTSSFAGVDMKGFKNFRFPMPPLAVQVKVSSVLDSFSDLQAELEAELESRKAQVEHYRNQLLTFKVAS